MKALTAREESCLYWAAHGKTSWEIGAILGITERTVNFHIANTCTKFDVYTRQAAIVIALQTGLLPTPEGLFSGRSKNPARVHDQRPVAYP